MKSPSWKSTLPLLAGLVALGAWTLPAAEAQTPKKGGMLKFVVPDEPPSFDGHQRDDVRADPSDRAVLQHADPRQSREPGGQRVRVRPLHRDAQAGRRRQDLHLQDPQGRQVPRRLGADGQGRPRNLPAHRLPAAGRLERPQGAVQHGRERDRAGRRDGRLQAQVSLGRVHPRARHALQLHLLEGDPRQGPALVREERDGLRPVRVRRRARPAPSSRASAIPTTTTRASPTSTASRRSSPRRRRCACRRSAATRRQSSSAASRPRAATISWPRSARTSRCRRATGTACCSSRPTSKKKPFDDVRVRRALTPGGRPLGRLQGPLQDRHRQGGRRHRLPGPSAGGDEGGAGEARRLLARHQQVARRRPSGC